MTTVPIVIGVMVGNMRKSDGDAREEAGMFRGYPSKILNHALVADARICLIDVGIHILDVDNPFLNERKYVLHILAWHIET